MQGTQFVPIPVVQTAEYGKPGQGNDTGDGGKWSNLGCIEGIASKTY